MNKKSRIIRFLTLFIDAGIYILPVSIAVEMIEEHAITLNNYAKLVFIICFLLIFVLIMVKKDTYFPKQYRSLGKKIVGLYIVDENGKIVKDKSLIEQKNKITTLSGIYRAIIFNESKAENKLKIYVESKENLN